MGQPAAGCFAVWLLVRPGSTGAWPVELDRPARRGTLLGLADRGQERERPGPYRERRERRIRRAVERGRCVGVGAEHRIAPPDREPGPGGERWAGGGGTLV